MREPDEREVMGITRPLLDDRRYVESIITGLKIPAHPDFRVVCHHERGCVEFECRSTSTPVCNADLYIDFPEADEELMILKENLPSPRPGFSSMWSTFSSGPMPPTSFYSVRERHNIARYALK